MRSQVTNIDPIKAEALLKKGGINRYLSPNLVEKYARDMRAGKWLLTGEPIIISTEGVVLDGQHRLHAVVLSNATVAMLVVYGVAPEALHAIDTGKSRSVGNVLQILGYKSGSRLASVAKHVHDALSGFTAISLSVADAEAIVKKYPGILWVMEQEGAAGGSRTSVAPVLAGFAIAYGKNPEEIVKLWQPWNTGDLRSGDPLLALRNYLTNTAATQNITATSSGRRALVRRTLTAIAYRLLGKPLMKSLDGYDGVEFFIGTRVALAAAKKSAAAGKKLPKKKSGLP